MRSQKPGRDLTAALTYSSIEKAILLRLRPGEVRGIPNPMSIGLLLCAAFACCLL